MSHLEFFCHSVTWLKNRLDSVMCHLRFFIFLFLSLDDLVELAHWHYFNLSKIKAWLSHEPSSVFPTWSTLHSGKNQALFGLFKKASMLSDSFGFFDHSGTWVTLHMSQTSGLPQAFFWKHWFGMTLWVFSSLSYSDWVVWVFPWLTQSESASLDVISVKIRLDSGFFEKTLSLFKITLSWSNENQIQCLHYHFNPFFYCC